MAKPSSTTIVSSGPKMDPGKADPTGHQLDHISHTNGVGHDHDSTGYANGVGHAKFHEPEDSGNFDVVSSVSEDVTEDGQTDQPQEAPTDPLEIVEEQSLEQQAEEIFDALFNLPSLPEDDFFADEMDEDFLAGMTNF